MLIRDVRGNEYHVNLSQVVCANVYWYESGPTEYRIEMTNCDYVCVSEDVYDRVVALLDGDSRDSEPHDDTVDIVERNNQVLRDTVRGQLKQNAALREENERLRLFAAEIYENQCDDCDKWKYRDRMQVLGIEVEE
jgi:hypothetical protein